MPHSRFGYNPADLSPQNESVSTGALQQDIALFLTYLSDERHFSAKTTQAYGTDLRQLAEFLAQHKMSTDSVGIEKSEIRHWLRVISPHLSASTLARKVATLRAFFRFLNEVGKRAENPAAGIRLPKVRKKLPLIVSAEVANELMESPPESGGPKNIT